MWGWNINGIGGGRNMKRYRIVKKESGRFYVQIHRIFLFWSWWVDYDSYVRDGLHPRAAVVLGCERWGICSTFEGAMECIDNLLHPENNGPEVVGGPYTKNTMRGSVKPKHPANH